MGSRPKGLEPPECCDAASLSGWRSGESGVLTVLGCYASCAVGEVSLVGVVDERFHEIMGAQLVVFCQCLQLASRLFR